MLRQIDIKYTPFAELREGDEFVRVGMRPVLLRDISGTRAGGHFQPWFFGRGRSLDIRRMVMTPGGWLDEVNLAESDLHRNALPGMETNHA